MHQQEAVRFFRGRVLYAPFSCLLRKVKVQQMRRYIVFVSKDHYNPLGIARTLGEAGLNPIAVVVRSEPKQVALSKYVKEKYYVDNPFRNNNKFFNFFTVDFSG